MHTRRAIVWFRQDLRLHDNEALTEALASADEVAPVYVFDERIFKGKTHFFGFPKAGKFRARFIIESIHGLRQSLQARGSNLIVRVGKPEEEIFSLAKELRSSWVFCNRERTRDEESVQDALEKNLWSIGQEMRYSRGKLLYYTADLPFPIQHTPDTFAQFRKEVERYVPVRDPLPAPEKLAPLSVRLDAGDIPTLRDFRHEEFEPDGRAALVFRGGETEALRRLRYYIWESGLASRDKPEREALAGGDYSAGLSPWLAQGCLSPKLVYRELKRFEAEFGVKEGANGIYNGLLRRDFYRFMAKKHGNGIFLRRGPHKAAGPQGANDWEYLQNWMEGATGMPLVDAAMRELRHTGYLSGRCRLNVASYLVNDLKVNWQMGAEYFESVLIDYDVASNWGNWNAAAGVGADPRENRCFNVLSQAQRYDPQGEYVKRWLPELGDLPPDSIHLPQITCQ